MLSNQGEDADRNVVKVSFVSFSSTTAIQINETFERFSNWHKLKKFVGWATKTVPATLLRDERNS